LILAATMDGSRIVYQVGGWQAPFGITLLADGLTGIMLVMTSLLVLTTIPFAAGTLDLHRESNGFYPLTLLLLMGVSGAFLTGDLFNLYVFFELFLVASFVLMTLGGTPAQINGGIRYVALNLIASLIFLTCAGVVYGTLGTLNLAQMAQRMDNAPQGIVYLIAGLMLVAFGSKAALFPLFFWLPASYHTPHPAVTVLFGGILTKVGVYTLFRLYPLLFPSVLLAWQPLLLTIAALTMIVGALGALGQPTIRRLLSFGIISQIGYMLMALAISLDTGATTAGFALAAGILFMVHNMLVKTALLIGGGVAEIEMGSGNLNAIGGLAKQRKLLAVLFFLAAFSVAGIPPFSGFTGKLALLQATLGVQQWWMAGVILGVAVLTLMYMVRIWQYTFWGDFKSGIAQWTPLRRRGARWLTMTPMALLVALSLALGIFFEPAVQIATVAAQQVLDRDGYIAAVNPQNEVAGTGNEAEKANATELAEVIDPNE
jgi:multicomponent Na+:H+ antiporter subunit D